MKNNYPCILNYYYGIGEYLDDKLKAQRELDNLAWDQDI